MGISPNIDAAGAGFARDSRGGRENWLRPRFDSRFDSHVPVSTPSKKWENHESHLAIYFMYYNFCRVHQTLKTTPAVRAELTDAVWSVERMLDELANN
jgi:hypothetical protein